MSSTRLPRRNRSLRQVFYPSDMSLLCSLIYYDRIERRDQPDEEWLPDLPTIDLNAYMFDVLANDVVVVHEIATPAKPYPRRRRRRRRPDEPNQALDAINDFTRMRMREDGFYRRIMPPITISNDQLDRAIATDRPILIVDRMAESPGDALE
jgi:hypothetical protein